MLGRRAPLGCAALFLYACDAAPPAANTASALTTAAPLTAAPATANADPAPLATPTTDTTPAPSARDTCPSGMLALGGGEFWLGSPAGKGTSEDRPRFLTHVAPFCLDQHEVTTDSYASCVASGRCTLPHGTQRTCNYGREGRGNHPINCVDWQQAQTFCETRGARLPSELEWEYAARGGSEYRQFSWGNDAPEGRTCWNRNQTCAVESYASGAFGLFDMTGNVWEWTLDWYGLYPWQPSLGHARVYRGGSWSRRFEKWMVATLRNRSPPSEWGSHLGLRCAQRVAADCRFGVGNVSNTCARAVLDVECSPPQKFNGMRCAAPGEPLCSAGSEPSAARGCVLKAGRAPAQSPRQAAEPSVESSRARSSEFDADCLKNQRLRPHAYRLAGGTHAARNALAQSLGCKNRDVGVGWNSVCCP
jgi:formylglycine-generating enzyme required for sulfatase activity